MTNKMVKSIIKLNLELKEGQMLDTDMEALKKFLSQISRDDLIDIHNLTAQLINEYMRARMSIEHDKAK